MRHTSRPGMPDEAQDSPPAAAPPAEAHPPSDIPEAEARLESALKQMEEGVVILDAQGRMALLNPAARRIVGGSADERSAVADWPATLGVFDAAGAALPVAEYPIIRALRGETVRDTELQLRRLDGVTLHVVVHAQPLYSSDGRPLGALSVFRDITEEHRTRKERETLRRLSERLTVSTTPTEIAEFAHDSARELFNPDSFVLDLYQPATKQLASILLMDTVDGVHQKCVIESLRPCGPVWPALQGQPMVVNRAGGDERSDLRVVGSGQRSASLIFVPIRKDGRTVGLLSLQSYTLNKFTDGDVPLIQELADLIGPPLANAFLRQELDRRRSDDAQHERLLSLGQMASGVAHNFNNALTGVLGYAELLLMRPDVTADVRAMLESIRASGRDAAGVVSRLMKFCRAQNFQQDFAAMDLNQLVADVVRAAQHLYPPDTARSPIHWNVKLCPAAPIFGHPGDLREVVTNLISNAVDAMPNGGTISVQSRVDDASIQLELADTGVGMSSEVREHCFEPFYVSKAERGAGLGLAIVHGIIKRHGGRIEVWSEPHQGTRFTIRFPLAPAQSPGGDVFANSP